LSENVRGAVISFENCRVSDCKRFKDSHVISLDHVSNRTFASDVIMV